MLAVLALGVSLQASRSLYALWPDGACKRLDLQDKVNASIVAVMQAMVNASNSAAVASLLNGQIGNLGSAAGGGTAASMVRAKPAPLRMRTSTTDRSVHAREYHRQTLCLMSARLQ